MQFGDGKTGSRTMEECAGVCDWSREVQRCFCGFYGSVSFFFWLFILPSHLAFSCLASHPSFFLLISKIRKGMETSQNLSSQFRSALSSALEDVDTANRDLISSIDSESQLHNCLPSWLQSYSSVFLFRKMFLGSFLLNLFQHANISQLPRCKCNPCYALYLSSERLTPEPKRPSDLCRFIKTWPWCMWKPQFHDCPLSRGPDGIEGWPLPPDCGNHRQCRKMPSWWICCKNLLI